MPVGSWPACSTTIGVVPTSWCSGCPKRFPTWMWRNAVVLDFVGWLREHNDRLGADEPAKAGFYGLDLYSLYRSIHEVIAYLDRVDPAAAARARERYACLEQAGGDGQAYGFAAACGVSMHPWTSVAAGGSRRRTCPSPPG